MTEGADDDRGGSRVEVLGTGTPPEPTVSDSGAAGRTLASGVGVEAGAITVKDGDASDTTGFVAADASSCCCLQRRL